MTRSKIEQRRIAIVASLILIISAATVGVTVFTVMKSHAEGLLRINLQNALQSNVELAQSEIRQSFEKSATVATRPYLIHQIAKIDTDAKDAHARNALLQGVASFLSTGLDAIALYDQHGRKIVQAGDFVAQPELQIPIRFAQDTQLLYKHQYYLRAAINIVDEGRIIGKVVTQDPLPTLSNAFHGTLIQRDKTADLALCGLYARNRMQCFPTTLNPHVQTLATTSGTGTPLPMSHALAGKTGFVVANDYRNREVVAAYAPLGSLGLGMVLKMDSRELYAPVWHQLRHLVPLMILMFAGALLALHWLLAPLVNQLVRSERAAREANTRLRDSENHVRLLLENADEGIISIAADGIIELFNPAAERIFQYARADVLGRNISILMTEPVAHEHDRYLARYLKDGDPHVIGTVRVVDAVRSNGEIFPIELRISEFSLNDERKFIGIMHDITERKAAEARIVHLAHYDALTDLPNRRLVQDRIQSTITRVQRSQTPFAVMFIDLNRFKEINDTLGHDAGDQLLKVVAQRLTATLRAEDTVGRQGGDEFIVLLANLGASNDSVHVAEKIIEVLSEPVEIHGQIVTPSASVGIAVYPQDGEDVDSLLKHSDEAMYLAKQVGGGVYRFYSRPPGMNSRTE